MIKSLVKIISILLVVGLNWAGLSAVWQTSAYFNDVETSLVNTFSAANLDFSLNGGVDFSPGTLNLGGSATRNISLQNDGSLGFQYKVGYEEVSGNLCDYLNLTAGVYSGLLKDFTNQGPFTFSGTPSWDFTVSLPLDAPDDLQGEVCNFKFVFNGWQENLTEGQGFSDTEEITNTILADYWNPPVVLNEILPNPEGDDCSLSGINGEWVEIYNKTSSPLDLADWYIEDADGNRITIQTINTLGGSTTIDANGWLVVFLNYCILDNTADTVSLYNNNGVQADSYSYAVPDYNINNTPGSTNDMAMYLPLNGDTNDQSGNGNNGTNNGAVFESGKINQGLSFDGTDDYVNCGTNGSLNILNELTIEAWINPDTVLKSYYHSSIVDRGNSYWFLILKTGELAFLRFNQNDPETGYGRFSLLSTAATIPTGTWTHVAATYSVFGGNAVKLYINGELSGAGSFTNGPIDSSGSALTIGNRMGLHNFDGSIDEIKIYNRALDDSEVASHYGQVPENKSYARIPDGSSNWVDPVPTPGGPNIEIAEINNFADAIELSEQKEIFVMGEIAEEEAVSEDTVIGQMAIGQNGELAIITEEITTTEENQGQGGIIEEINEIIDEVINEIVDEIMPDEEIGDEVVLELEAPVIEDVSIIEEAPADEIPVIEEQPVIETPSATEEQPVIASDNVSVEQTPAPESGGDSGGGETVNAAPSDGVTE